MTILDICFFVSDSQFLNSPCDNHWNAVVWILRYINGSPGKGLSYMDNGHASIIGYTDAHGAGDVGDRRSTTDYCVFIGGNVISWKSKNRLWLQGLVPKQNIVLWLIQHVNFYLWLNNLLQELKFCEIGPMELACDNQLALHLSSNPIFHRRTKHKGASWTQLLLLYAYVQVSRCVVVGALFPLLRYFGYGLDWKEAIILIWSGLRGAVALSLSLSRSSGRSVEFTPETGTLFVFFTGGIVFLTLIINGSTTQFILHYLGMDKLSAAKRRILDFTKYEMLNKALEAFSELGDDEELGPVDWPTVKRYISCLNDIEGERVYPHGAPENDSNLDTTNLKDIRVRLLNGVQAAYWEMLNEGRISQTTANILMLSIEEAIDLASSEPLCDWKGLKDNVHFPNYYKFLQSSVLPPKLVTYFTVGRLESACYICAAFLRAHRIARQQLHDFIGDSDVASAVINESVVEGEEARKFLEDVNVAYPQVLRVVKTRQTTYAVLNHLIEYVQNLEKVGILEEKEMLQLHDAVQTDLKKLLRNPPLVKLPKTSNMHPMLGVLPSLASYTKETMKLRGLTLYKEGAKSNGIWLISNGVVKWESKMTRTKNAFYPTFTHGSTLGLYEVLTGRSYVCDVVTDSVVFCIFLEADKIISCLKSDPSTEKFLWEESSIFLSKLMLPQIFEKLAMQDLRALIADPKRSKMTTFIRGETIEIPYHSVALLLEGYVKTQGCQELIAAPAALLPSLGNLSFLNLASSGSEEASCTYHGSCFLVETTARVIVLDIPASEVETALVRKSSSLLSHAGDHPHGSFRRKHKHIGLMSWPEHFYKHKNHNLQSEGVGRQTNSLSERAMLLSIYGSMVDIPPRSKSLLTNHGRPPHSLSYPTIVSHQGHPLVSVKSEGAATAKKVQEVTRNVTNPPFQRTERRQHHHGDNSSDDSDAEEDIIVRIDSPSKLSFC
ncbi:Sodium/hydrogen exchanger 7, partial [Mucuna pruriens]